MDEHIDLNSTEHYYVLIIDNISETIICTNTDINTDINSGNITDISIYTKNEWINLSKMINHLHTIEMNLTSESDDCYKIYSKEYTSAAYFLHFNNLGSKHLDIDNPLCLTESEIHKIVFDNCKIKYVTINKFRQWTAKKYDQIQEHYNRLI